MSGRHRRGHTPPPPPVGPSAPEHPLGPRRVALERRRKSRRRQVVGVTAGVTFLALLVIGGIVVSATQDDPAREDAHALDLEAAAPGEASTTLLVGTRGSGREARLSWAALLVHDPGEERSAIAFIPARTAAEIPGRGVQSLREAFSTGGLPLFLVSTQNLLGVTVDRYLRWDEADVASLLAPLAPLEVDVPTDVVSDREGAATTLVPRGEQSLDAGQLRDLLFVEGGDDLGLGPRHLAFWTSLHDRARADEDSLERALQTGAEQLDDSNHDPDEVAGFLYGFLTVPEDRRDLRTLPVNPLEVPGNVLLVTDEQEVATLMRELAGEELVPGDEVRVQILNANGRPGIGQDVARLLVGKGYKVVLSGNAQRFDRRRTAVVVYEDTAEARASAERARELLGVGRVQVTAQEQGIVDMTIVVGRDFLRNR